MRLAKDILDLVEDMVDQGFVSKTKHPTYDIWTYKYTKECQFMQMWNDATKMCRGLVLDSEGNVVAFPMKKFFNYEELEPEEAKKIMTPPFQVTQKVDGSLGILMQYNNEYIVSTQGSFVSEQAKWATKMVNTVYKEKVELLDLDHYTYLFEIVYPENRIVVDYGDRAELSFLAKIDKETGEDIMLKREEFEKMAPFSHPEVYDDFSSKTFEELKELNWDNAEGFVVHSKYGRLKIKFEKYIELHKTVTNLNEKTVWEAMMEDKVEELRANVPEETLAWVDEVRDRIREDWYEIVSRVAIEHDLIIDKLGEDVSQKDFALEVLANYKHDSGYLFAVHAGKDIVRDVLKSLKPKIVPYRRDEDGE